jgi:hypothetical protein
MSFDFKNASKELLKSEYNRIAKEIGDDQFFTKKELYHLPKVLADGEQVIAFSSGFMDGHTWLIALTDRRIIFLDKGMIYGLTQTSIDLDKVNAVGGKTGILYGTITIEDGASRRSITRVWKRTVVPFTNKVRDAMESRKAAHRGSLPMGGGDDVVSKLERLAMLKEKGVLSQQEFEQQKARLLRG